MTARRDLLCACATLTALASLAPAAAAQRVLAEHFGNQALARFGAALATAGDIDGDGLADLVVGEPHRDYAPQAGTVDSGAAVLLGSRSGTVRSRNLGLQTFGMFGSTVAGLGDVDGDGVPDWAAGSASMGNQGAGHARILSGADGHTLWTANGEDRSELGSGIAGVGDADFDGRADVAVSSPHNSTVRAYGTVRVHAGDTGAYLHQYAGNSGDLTGQSIASIADVTGDGQPDLIVGEPDFAFTGTGSGHVYLFDPLRPAASGLRWEVMLPFQAGWHGGQVVAAAGDVDGDGVPDVLAGTTVGRVFVLSGQNGAELRRHSSGDAGFGDSLAGIGDFDGDGRDDYAVGAPGAGNGAGRVFVYSGRSGAVLAVLDGDAGSNFGAGLARLGDFDGDGRSDFAVGAPLQQHNGQLLGRVSVHAWSINPLGERFGSGCAGVAGVPDLYVAGAPSTGSSFAVRCGNLPANALGLWLFGLSRTLAGSVPLPLDLGLVGIPGCQLLVSAELVEALHGGARSYVPRQFDVPAVPTLAGFELFAQAALLDAVRVGGLAFSNGVRIRIGNH